MPELCQHVNLIAELFQKLFVNFRIEILFHSHSQSLVHTLVNRTKPTHRNLLPYLQIPKINFQHKFTIQIKRLFLSMRLLYRQLIQLLLQLFDPLLFGLKLIFHLNDSSKCLGIVHFLLWIQPWRRLCLWKKLLVPIILKKTQVRNIGARLYVNRLLAGAMVRISLLMDFLRELKPMNGKYWWYLELLQL